MPEDLTQGRWHPDFDRGYVFGCPTRQEADFCTTRPTALWKVLLPSVSRPTGTLSAGWQGRRSSRRCSVIYVQKQPFVSRFPGTTVTRVLKNARTHAPPTIVTIVLSIWLVFCVYGGPVHLPYLSSEFSYLPQLLLSAFGILQWYVYLQFNN